MAAKDRHGDVEKALVQVVRGLGLNWKRRRRRVGGKCENARGAIMAWECRLERLLLATGNREALEAIATMELVSGLLWGSHIVNEGYTWDPHYVGSPPTQTSASQNP